MSLPYLEDRLDLDGYAAGQRRHADGAACADAGLVAEDLGHQPPKDNDFDVAGVRDVMDFAQPIYELHKARDRLQAYYPEAPHSFPEDARKRAYEFMAKHLKK